MGHREFSIVLSSVIVLLTLGCSKQQETTPMITSFHPSDLESLSEIDLSDASYDGTTTDIQGVVSLSSQGGWSGDSGTYNVHYFSLAAWQKPGSEVVRQDLTVLLSVPPDADYWDEVPELSIIGMRVLLSSDETRAVLIEEFPITSSVEQLLSIAEELEKPVRITHESFGELELDRSIDWFEGVTEWNGTKIDLRFPVEDSEGTISSYAMNTAESLWNDQAKWNRLIEETAVEKLLELKNGTWLKEGEFELTADEFVQKMKLQSVSISSNGEFDFWFDDGDLFWGHAIRVTGNIKDGPNDASIQG